MVMKTGRRKTTRDARGSLFWLFLVVHCLIGSVAAAVELTDEERDFLREKAPSSLSAKPTTLPLSSPIPPTGSARA